MLFMSFVEGKPNKFTTNHLFKHTQNQTKMITSRSDNNKLITRAKTTFSKQFQPPRKRTRTNHNTTIPTSISPIPLKKKRFFSYSSVQQQQSNKFPTEITPIKPIKTLDSPHTQNQQLSTIPIIQHNTTIPTSIQQSPPPPKKNEIFFIQPSNRRNQTNFPFKLAPSDQPNPPPTKSSHTQIQQPP